MSASLALPKKNPTNESAHEKQRSPNKRNFQRKVQNEMRLK